MCSRRGLVPVSLKAIPAAIPASMRGVRVQVLIAPDYRHFLSHPNSPNFLLQANEVIQSTVGVAGLLTKAARTGDIEMWRVLVEELRRRGFLQEVRHADD